jgi:dienelactone hydrolase
VLAGYSNGAQTAATYPGDEFKARVIVAWTCNNPRAAAQNGMKGSGPALAVLGTADDYYQKIGISGDCGSALANRAGSRSILIKGGTHEILDHAETRGAVSAFMPGVLK